MPIISSIIAEDQAQADGRRTIREVHTDHLGREHWVQYRAASDTDVNAVMLARVPSIDADLAEAEIEKIIGIAESGGDLVGLPLPEFTTKAIAIKRVLKWFWKNRAWKAWNCIDLVNALPDVYLIGTIGLTAEEVTVLRSRVVKLTTALSAIDDADVGVTDGDL